MLDRNIMLKEILLCSTQGNFVIKPRGQFFMHRHSKPEILRNAFEHSPRLQYVLHMQNTKLEQHIPT